MKVLALACSLAPFAGPVGAHGFLSQPAAAFKDRVVDTNFSAILASDIDPGFRGRDWDGSPSSNAANFAGVFHRTRFHSLRHMIDSVVVGCGSTEFREERVDVSPLRSMWWQNDDARVGFDASHHGPCEVWIDNSRVFVSSDCRADYTDYPAEIPIDFSICHGNCSFLFYWLALQDPEWEAHKQCVSIVNPGKSTSKVSPRRLGGISQYLLSGFDSLFSKADGESMGQAFKSSMSAGLGGLGGLSSLVGLRR